MYTYPLIVLIKLDFQAPESPVIAISTCTSFHPSILLLKNFAMESGLRRPFFSTSFWKSCTYFDSQFIAKERKQSDTQVAKVGLNNDKALLTVVPK